MKFISKGKIVATYDEETKLNFSVNGKEFELLFSTFDLIRKEANGRHRRPTCFGGNGSKQLRINGFLAREQGDIDSFPDCVIINETEVICIEHTKIDASKATKRKGSAYQQRLGKTEDLSKIFGNNFPDSFNAFLVAGNIEFSISYLRKQLISALKKKVARIPKYQESIAKYIRSGTNEKFIREDLGKPIFAWLFIEDISPLNFSDGLFADEEILKFLEKHNELKGIIYLHHPHVTSAPRDLCDVVIIFNNSSALKELRALNREA